MGDAAANIILKYFTSFTDKQWQQMLALEDLYKEWNSKVNIISRKDMDSLYEKHVLHSLSMAAIADFNAKTHILDLGTGGGFPGIPLAIFFPETPFLLIDAIGKKIKVVQAIADALQLHNVTTKHIRAEDIKNEKFDFVLSRAVAPLKDLWKWSKPLLQKGKKCNLANGLICLKGGDLHEEISQSHCRPKMIALTDIFPEEYFTEKYLLYVPA